MTIIEDDKPEDKVTVTTGGGGCDGQVSVRTVRGRDPAKNANLSHLRLAAPGTARRQGGGQWSAADAAQTIVVAELQTLMLFARLHQEFLTIWATAAHRIRESW